MEFKEPFYSRLWFVWIALTLSYLVLSLVFEVRFAYFVGLFVPFGLYNYLASLSLAGFVTIPLLALSLFYADSIALKLKITTPFKKLVFNLVWLLLLTLVIDLILWNGVWQSLNLFLHEEADPLKLRNLQVG